jgi:hypothetical protein
VRWLGYSAAAFHLTTRHADGRPLVSLLPLVHLSGITRAADKRSNAHFIEIFLHLALRPVGSASVNVSLANLTEPVIRSSATRSPWNASACREWSKPSAR